jgi:hypothetical protein
MVIVFKDTKSEILMGGFITISEVKLIAIPFIKETYYLRV